MKGTLLALVALGTAPLAAAPTVSSAAGTFVHGGTVSITGSGFGTKAEAAPNLWDTVENQSTYAALNNGSPIPRGAPHPYDDSGAAANTESTLCTVGGEQRHRFSSENYKMSDSVKNNLSRVRHAVPGQRLYIAWWFKTDTDLLDPINEHSSKYLRASAAVGDFSNRTFSWTQHQNYVYDSDSTCPSYFCSQNWDAYAPPVNQWVFFEALFNTENFSYVLKTDNRVLTNSSYVPGTTPFAAMWVIGYDGGGVSPPPITSWIDDVYIDGTEQRVVIGNAATLAECTHVELQPPSSWSPSGITVRVNQGSFPDGPAYLYVVDAAGAPNAQGHVINLGGPPATLAPAPPRGLGVQ